MDDLKDLFPIKEKFAYFITSSAGPLSKPAFEAIQRFSEQSMITGCYHFADWLQMADEAKLLASQLIKCESKNIAFVKSTSHGLWIASRMIDWQAGDEVILPRGEYPANFYPWQSLESLGVKIRYLEDDLDPKLNSVTQVNIEALRKLINSKTRALSVSFVQYDNGCRRDIESLGTLCREASIVFIIDAMQGLGALPLDSSSCQADFIASGCQKWLLSPHGLGLLYVKSRWLEINKAPNIGFYSLSEPFNFSTQSYSQTLQRLSPDGRRFEESCPNFLALAALKANLEIILSFGIDWISKRIKELTDRLMKGLERLGYRTISLRENDLWSGIVSFESKDIPAIEIKEKLAAHKILIGANKDVLRVSVHFFNDEPEVDRLLGVLANS